VCTSIAGVVQVLLFLVLGYTMCIDTILLCTGGSRGMHTVCINVYKIVVPIALLEFTTCIDTTLLCIGCSQPVHTMHRRVNACRSYCIRGIYNTGNTPLCTCGSEPRHIVCIDVYKVHDRAFASV
jgi:hypothetical protein